MRRWRMRGSCAKRFIPSDTGRTRVRIRTAQHSYDDPYDPLLEEFTVRTLGLERPAEVPKN